jgi:putative heme-binding domain-containing protein
LSFTTSTPSDRIHPGYESFTVALKGGQVAMGVVRWLNENQMEILDTDAKSLKIAPDDIEELRPSTSSVMPSGLAGTLGEAAMRDLVEFLTAP